MSDSLNFLSRVICGVEGGGALANRYADIIVPDSDTQGTLESNKERSEEIKTKFLKDLGG